MKSHSYEFTASDVVAVLSGPLLVVALIAATVYFSKAVHLLPPPRPTLDVDRTILFHQVEASRSPSDAEVLLVGDSSCLMDVAADELQKKLSIPVLNLGTFSYLDLNAYASLIRSFAQANPGRPKVIVLLMHPEALRRPAPSDYHMRLLMAFLDGRDAQAGETLYAKVSAALGVELFRGRLLSRTVPSALAGAYGRAYGFSRELERFMREHNGSVIDPQPQAITGNAEYRLAPPLERASRAFKSAVPPGTKLVLGITPVPSQFVPASYVQKHTEMLARWSEWLGADATLAELPATLPEHLFSQTTHLNQAGVKTYTELLAGALQKHLQ